MNETKVKSIKHYEVKVTRDNKWLDFSTLVPKNPAALIAFATLSINLLYNLMLETFSINFYTINFYPFPTKKIVVTIMINKIAFSIKPNQIFC